MVIWAFCRTQERYDRYRCRFPRNESSLKLIADACSATVVLDLVYKNKTQNARYLGRKIVRNIPVQGWRICKNETAMDYWSVCFFYVIVVIDLMRANYLSAPPPPTSPDFHIGNERWVHHPYFLCFVTLVTVLSSHLRFLYQPKFAFMNPFQSSFFAYFNK